MAERVLTPIERECPTGWTAHAVHEFARNDDGGLYVTAWTIDRDGCDCQMRLGVRVDNGELIFGMTPCGEHRTIVEATLLKLRVMKGQPRQIHSLAGEIFEAKLAKATRA